MKFQPKESELKLMLNNAVTWFDELVRINGCQCSTSTFIHNMLVKVYTDSQMDGSMLWDEEMIEKAFPVAIKIIKHKEREKVIHEILWELEKISKSGG